MRDQPTVYTARTMKAWDWCADACVNGRYIPARPLPFYRFWPWSLWHRLRCAWLVFTGRCDVLDWEH